MNTIQLERYYTEKKHTDCPLTKKLIKAGYQQLNGGYIDYAYERGFIVDYRVAEPNQWWHLMCSYCKRTPPNKYFGENILSPI